MRPTTSRFRLAVLGATALSLTLSAFAAGTEADALLPVAGSLRGGFGSVFKTSAQLHNRTDRAAKGTLIFHPAGATGASTDPSLAYDLAPRSTVSYDDVIEAMGVQGIGSIDVIVAEGAVPAIVARIYDDQSTGTSGAGVRLMDPDEAIQEGERGSLIVPGDLGRFRFNIGIRTLDEGAVVMLSVWSESGMMRSSLLKTFPANFFQQQAAQDFVLATLLANDSISIDMVAGSAILYGTTTDNSTNDPAIQGAPREARAAQ